MSTPNRYGTRSVTRGHRHQTSQPSIHQYFRDSQWQTVGTIVAVPRENCMETSPAVSHSGTQTLTPEPDPLIGTPAVFRADMDVPSQSQSQLDADLHTMLQALPMGADIEALPTRADIESLILRIEEAHSKDIQEVRTELHSVTDRVASGETLVASLVTCVQALERARESQTVETQEMQLHL